jgi:hypothetical protein
LDEGREAAYFRRETEEAKISQRRMTPRERDAFIDEYNAGLLTPEERDRFARDQRESGNTAKQIRTEPRVPKAEISSIRRDSFKEGTR